MRVAVMGAGAVGCYFGGMLARAGHDVTLIGRPLHVEAMRRTGLLMETLSFREHVQVRADTEVAAAQGAELVLFCVKSVDTESAASAIGPFLTPDGTILSLQNGVDNAQRLQTAAGRQVLPSVVYVAVEMPGAGHVLHQGRGELVLPDCGDGSRMAEVLRAAGIPVHLSDNLLGAQWTKLVVNCALNALSAIAQEPFGPLLRTEGIQDLMRDIVEECLAVARAAGIHVPGDPWDAIRRTGSQVGQYSSMAQDMARRRRTEIEHLNGYVVRQGEALGVPTPANRCLLLAVRLLEARTPGAPGPMSESPRQASQGPRQ